MTTSPNLQGGSSEPMIEEIVVFNRTQMFCEFSIFYVLKSNLYASWAVFGTRRKNCLIQTEFVSVMNSKCQ
jgi:hypothetical protein